jgi:hypothetical protein
MECRQCELLETIRFDRIKRYCQCFEERKRVSAKAELTRKIQVIELELNDAWRRLDLHRRTHELVTSRCVDHSESGQNSMAHHPAPPHLFAERKLLQ